MSTFLRGSTIAAGLALSLAACATPSSDADRPYRFAQLGLRPAPPPEPEATLYTPPSAARPAAPSRRDATPANVDAVAPRFVPAVDVGQAIRRVDVYLAAEGFATEASVQGNAQVVDATRMAEPRRLAPEAACSLEAMRRPDFSAANLTVRLAPMPGGVEVGVQARFAEVDTNLISGNLVRQACRSRGVLEVGVRRAAQGG